MKQYAPACERNQMFILEVFRRMLPDQGLVLEIGSGTGQHAACFAPEFTGLDWQPTDIGESLGSIAAWREDTKTPNLLSPLELDLANPEWPVDHADVVVCINTIHIVAWPLVVNLIAGASRILPVGGVLYLYGPFRYRDRPLEPSNISFDQWLKARDQMK